MNFPRSSAELIKNTSVISPTTLPTVKDALDNLSGRSPTAIPVPITEGGTGQTTANAAFNALAPTTTRGDLIYRNATVNARLALGASGTFLRSNGTDPVWQTASEYALLAGAAFTGSVSITGGSFSVNQAAASALTTISASAGQLRLVGFQTAGSNRWYIGADNVAESGSNVGSDFGIFRYADNGAFLGNPVVINRANGNVGLANNLGVSGTIDGTTGVYDGGVRVARTNAAQTFSARQDISPGGTNICLVATRGGDLSPHLYIDMNSSVNTGDQFIRFVSAGTTSGSVTANGASNVAYNTSSDPRLKKDLELLDLTESVERIKALRLWKGKWKIDGSPFRGILTTELQHVIPEAVTGPEGGIEEEWVVGSEEQPRRIIRKPDEDGFAKIEAKAPKDADLHPLGEQIAPQMWDPGKAMPDVMGALQWALGKIEQLEARLAAISARPDDILRD